MTRTTSIEAYNQIKDEGLLGTLQFAVYEKLFRYGPLTQGELWSQHFPDFQRHDIGPRVAELHKFGVVVSVGRRKCGVSGRTCMVWDVSDALPIKPEPREPKDTIIKRLTARVAELEAEVSRFGPRVVISNPQMELFP